MKSNARALARLDPGIRLVLLHGVDGSAAADLARGVTRRFDGETVIAANTLKDDPGALLAAASAIPMFGGVEAVRVDDAGDDALPAVTAVLDAPVTGNPVVIVAGALKKNSKLLARVEAAANALAVACHLPDAAATATVIGDLAAEHGLRLTRDAIAALAQATAGDRGVVRQELAKLALYLDATRAAPATAEAGDVAAIGADFADADLGALVDGVAGGSPAAVVRQLGDLGVGAGSGIPLLRAVARRFWLLLDLRSAVDGGASAARAVKGAKPPVFWRDEAAVTAQLARWRTTALRAGLARLLDAERAVKRSGSAGEVAIDQLLLALATQAERG